MKADTETYKGKPTELAKDQILEIIKTRIQPRAEYILTQLPIEL